jgi:hypothetical protein
MSIPGDPIHGELHSTDASSAVQIPIYREGSNTVRTLKADEYIEIHSLSLVSAPGGDVYAFLSTNGTLVNGETALRGTVSANGGFAMSRCRLVGVNAANPYVIAPAGAVDVIFSGVIRTATATDARPTWRESLTPGV